METLPKKKIHVAQFRSKIISLVGKLFKTALFAGLFYLSFRYVRPHHKWTPAEARAWWRASDWLGVRNPEGLYIGVWITIELIVAVLAYRAIMRMWQHYRGKQQVDK
ncbi:hypothetical protein DM39_710 [Burkholderia cenocepacia]|uniref:Transmembrane protein n=1 Tax=Burkholderia cenocepacia TaxID=95486 RepID=A0AAN0RPR5_9BURK|nr:hypothetical protein DM39_710 [Burkholderia cenocepacia]